MPLQLWVQAARLGLRIKEVGVPRLYLDPNRAFGGVLNDAEERLAYYRGVIARPRLTSPVRRCRPIPLSSRVGRRRAGERPSQVRAPKEDGAVVAEPPLSQAAAVIGPTVVAPGIRPVIARPAPGSNSLAAPAGRCWKPPSELSAPRR